MNKFVVIFLLMFSVSAIASERRMLCDDMNGIQMMIPLFDRKVDKISYNDYPGLNFDNCIYNQKLLANFGSQFEESVLFYVEKDKAAFQAICFSYAKWSTSFILLLGSEEKKNYSYAGYIGDLASDIKYLSPKSCQLEE